MHPPLLHEGVITGEELTGLCFEKSQALRTAKMRLPMVPKPMQCHML